MHKVRIIALYIQYRDGVPDEDRRRLYQHARLTLAEQDAVNALVHFGVRITRVGISDFNKISIINSQKGPTDKDVKKKIKQKPSAGEEYELSRFKPALKTVLEVHFALLLFPGVLIPLLIHLQDQAGDKLETTIFPYVKDAPSVTPLSPRSPPPQTTSLRSQKPAWHRAPKAAALVDNHQRILIFVAGGMTYSEIREVYQLSSALQKDIYIGKDIKYLY